MARRAAGEDATAQGERGVQRRRCGVTADAVAASRRTVGCTGGRTVGCTGGRGQRLEGTGVRLERSLWVNGARVRQGIGREATRP